MTGARPPPASSSPPRQTKNSVLSKHRRTVFRNCVPSPFYGPLRNFHAQPPDPLSHRVLREPVQWKQGPPRSSEVATTQAEAIHIGRGMRRTTGCRSPLEPCLRGIRFRELSRPFGVSTWPLIAVGASRGTLECGPFKLVHCQVEDKELRNNTNRSPPGSASAPVPHADDSSLGERCDRSDTEIRRRPRTLSPLRTF